MCYLKIQVIAEEKAVFQSTLRDTVYVEGIGVHSGELCHAKIHPAEKDTGIVFVDEKTKKQVRANYKNVANSILCTKLIGDITVSTVEHVSSALYGLNITNAIIEVDNSEMPILDGSALEFVNKIAEVGTERQMAPRKALKIAKTIRLDDGDKWITFTPSDSLSINIKCDFSSKGLKTEPFKFDFSEDDYEAEIAFARTFGFFEDVDFLRKNNLALGASLDNTVVFDKNGKPLNKEGLRAENEPIRHKALDAIGDLAMSEYQIIGKYEAFCPSHKLNNMILRMLFSDTRNYEIF